MDKLKAIRQFRYYGSDLIHNEFAKENNYPNDPSFPERLIGGNIFNEYSAITKLGIQGRPGTMFYLNDSNYPIVIGETGIYEIDLEGYGQIFRIKFDGPSLAWYDEDGKGDRLLIDIVFEGSGGSA